jgi:hypothetical protein
MALTILPRDGEPIAVQTQLQTIIDDVLTVVIVICGEDAGVDRVVEIAVGRATKKPDLRRVVWCPNCKLLSDEQLKRYFRKNKELTAIGLADKVAAALTIDEAQSGAEVELAFLAAEKQTPESAEA